MCAEALFQPQLLDRDGFGVGEELFNVIQAADIDLRPDFYKHIVLSGGTTMLPGLPSRLEKEVRKLHTKHVLGGCGCPCPCSVRVRVLVRVRGHGRIRFVWMCRARLEQKVRKLHT